MKILYVGYRFDYGKPERGLSFEHYNFYETLVHLGHEVAYLDIGAYYDPTHPGRVDEALWAYVERERPELVFSFLFGDEISSEAIAQVTRSGVTTVNWFADDHWRFESFSRRYAPSYSWVTTTAQSAVPRYRALGCDNVIKTQWAAPFKYRPAGLQLAHDVTFIGQVYGDRPQMVDRLRAAGVPVRTWGTGWAVRRYHLVAGHRPVLRSIGGRQWLARTEASTRCEQNDMITIFEQSRVNLNFTDASQGSEAQIKGRNFEAPACGGFLLTGASAQLEEYYEPGVEVAVFHDVDELVSMTKFYLRHDSERTRIAAAGLRRTLANHTYERRFSDIFNTMGITA